MTALLIFDSGQVNAIDVRTYSHNVSHDTALHSRLVFYQPGGIVTEMVSEIKKKFDIFQTFFEVT